LENFNKVLENSDQYVLGGFNIFKFDVPYLWKRMIINGIAPNKKLCIQNEKERDNSVIDVFILWKHNSFSCSLDKLSTALFGESPKTDMVGRDITHAFYANNIDMIKKYCEGDVKFTARCYDAIINPKPRIVPIMIGVDPAKPDEQQPSQEGLFNSPSKPEFSP
jgi:DNA polymerase elongation subunit (family B)